MAGGCTAPLLAALLALFVCAHCYEIHTPLVVGSSASFNLTGTPGLYYFDLDASQQYSQLSVNITFWQPDDPMPVLYVLLRRLAAFDSTLGVEQLLLDCERSAEIPAGVYEYACFSAALTDAATPLVPPALVVPLPPAGRWFVYVDGAGAAPYFQTLVALQPLAAACPPGLAGAACDAPVTPLVGSELSGYVQVGHSLFYSLVLAPNVGALVLDFDSMPAASSDDGSGVYFRSGAVPAIGAGLSDAAFALSAAHGVSGWLAPPNGTLFVGLLSNQTAFSFDFSLGPLLCSSGTNGAGCGVPPDQLLLCPLANTTKCTSTDFPAVLDHEWQLVLANGSWVYFSLQIDDAYYSLQANAQILTAAYDDDGDEPPVWLSANWAAVPVSPLAADGQTLVPPVLYPLTNRLLALKTTPLQVYYPAPGLWYIGLYTQSSVAQTVNLTLQLFSCPYNCSGNGVCNNTVCECKPDLDYVSLPGCVTMGPTINTIPPSGDDTGEIVMIVLLSVLLPLALLGLVVAAFFGFIVYRRRVMSRAYQRID